MGLAGSAGKSSQIHSSLWSSPPGLRVASSRPLLVSKAMAASKGTRPVVQSAWAEASVACPQLCGLLLRLLLGERRGKVVRRQSHLVHLQTGKQASE